MQRLIEILLGLDGGFLSREGDFALGFNPVWPWQQHVGAAAWNVAVLGLGLWLILWAYRSEGRSRAVRVGLGALRMALLLLVVGLLNRPVLTLSQSRTEPSVLPVLVDASASMRVKDVGDPAAPQQRLAAVESMLQSNETAALLNGLRQTHDVRLYRFDATAQPMETAAGLAPAGQATDVAGSVRRVLEELQGQRVAGVVVFTDGRDSPPRVAAEALRQVAPFEVKVFPVAVGSERPPANLSVQNVAMEDSAFVGDIVNARVTLRGSGYPAGHRATVRLIDQRSGQPLVMQDGRPAETEVELPASADGTVDTELQFRPASAGTLDVAVQVVPQPGEIDEDDNSRVSQIAVLDAKINVLYVDGYPRWEYRYLKNEMIRDPSVEISCLLTSADPAFRQEGDRPITRFPESLNELLDYDVVVLGDVDPRQFSDFQLQLIAEFVSRLGGGFAMVSGPQFSPQAYRGTAIEPILPVNIDRAAPDDPRAASITQGFRPVLTRQGALSSIFRFFADRAENERFLAEQIQPLFWFARGVSVKPGIGETYAEHPSDLGPDGRKAPLLVLGRFGAGRTLFSAIDDSWRWRFYTGETVFDTYWIQQLRYLARGRKLGQRQVTLSSVRPTYELGEQARFNLRVLNPQLRPQLAEQLRLEVVEESTGAPVGQYQLVRQEGQPDLYVGAFPVDRTGAFAARVPSIAGGVDDLTVPFAVRVPRVELSQPQVDRPALGRLATQTGGQVIELADAAGRLPGLIPSAAKIIPIETGRPLWDAPLALALFVLLITAEWVGRKLFGMV